MSRNLFLSILAIAISCAAVADVEPIEIDGGRISGTIEDGIRVYKGIPYAAPPVGDLRWKEPQPVVPWEGIRDCSEYGPDCPQLRYPEGSIYRRKSPPEQSEDCLYLNVWTGATTADEKRPVMVWIHGGALTRGAGSIKNYDGTSLARKGVVLVNINYRLGVFGYLAHPELTAESDHHSSGNYGMLDMIAALQWVQHNIKRFGGDPDRVTIFGESAGSLAVHYLAASPLAKGLFHRGIGESGAASRPISRLKEGNDRRKSAEQVGLDFAESAGAGSLHELRALPTDKILDTFANPAQGRRFASRPNIDGWFLTDTVRDTYSQGKQNDVPLILGFNRDEMSAFIPKSMIPKTVDDYTSQMEERYGDLFDEFSSLYPVETEDDIKDTVIRSATEAGFGLSMRTWARMSSTGDADVYMYYFTRVPPSGDSEYYAAYHAAEIVYAFNNLHMRANAYKEPDFELADIMSDYWVNFAATGNPNGNGLPEWEPYTESTEAYMDLGDTVRPGNHLLKDKFDFFEKVPSRW